MGACTPVKVADPYRQQYPEDTSADHLARSIWCMCLRKDRIYFGCGDYWNNRGPVTIKSIGAAPWQVEDEIEVPEHMVGTIREHQHDLLVPGIDRTKWSGHGSFYRKHGDGWDTKNIPDARHVFDVAGLLGPPQPGPDGDVLLASYTTLRGATAFPSPPPKPRHAVATRGARVARSPDGGHTWEPLSCEGSQDIWGGFVPSIRHILIVGEDVYRYRALQVNHLQKLHAAVTLWGRLARFDGGIVASPVCPYVLTARDAKNTPLYWLGPGSTPATTVPMFDGEWIHVKDLKVRGEYLYVLSLDETRNWYSATYTTHIHRSNGLNSPDGGLWNWEHVATVELPAIPFSFDTFDGHTFLIGLGSMWWTWGDGLVDSGTIWEVEV